MSQQIPPPEKGAGNPPEKSGDGDAGKTEKVYKQFQVDDILNERTTKLDAQHKTKLAELDAQHKTKLAEKDAEIEKLRQAQMSEDDKKLEAARKEGAKEAESKLAREARRNGLTEALLDSGANPKRIRHLHAMAAEFAKPDAELKDVVELLKKESPEHFQGTTTNFGPGDGVTKPNQDQGEVDFSNPDSVQAKLASFKTQAEKRVWFMKHKDEIEMHQFGGSSIVRTVPNMGVASPGKA